MAAIAKAAMLPRAGAFITALEEAVLAADRTAELTEETTLLTEDASAELETEEAATAEAKARAAAMNFMCSGLFSRPVDAPAKPFYTCDPNKPIHALKLLSNNATLP
jgi:hypothetical protein